MDAASLRRAERTTLLALAARHGGTARLLHVVAPPGLRHERVAARRRDGRDASEADVGLLERQAGYWEPFDERERPLVVEADTTDPQSVARALAALRAADG